MAGDLSGGNLGDLLLREGLVNDDTLEKALRRQRDTSLPLGRILVEMNAISESVKLNFFQKTFGHDIVSLEDHTITPVLAETIPYDVATRYHVIPYKIDGETLVVAMEDPSDLVLLDNLKAQTGFRIRPVIASSNDIQNALALHPGADDEDYVPTTGNPVVKYLFFPLASFIPLGVVIGLLIMNDNFQNIMNHPPWGMTTGNMIFAMVLIWGLWMLLIYEIDGILVNPEHRQ